MALPTRKSREQVEPPIEVRPKYSPTPENAVRFAADIVAATLRVDGVELDYSLANLDRVDAILESFRADGLGPAQVGETILGFGFHVGEVMVREADAEWTSPGGTPLGRTPVFLP